MAIKSQSIFSSIFDPIASVVAPIVGGIYGGPAGAAAGTAVAGDFLDGSSNVTSAPTNTGVSLAGITSFIDQEITGIEGATVNILIYTAIFILACIALFAILAPTPNQVESITSNVATVAKRLPPVD